MTRRRRSTIQAQAAAAGFFGPPEDVQTSVIDTQKPTALPTSMKLDPPVANSMLGIIARAAADKNVDVEKMRALLEIQKEIRHEEARLEFIRSFIAASSEMPAVNKDGRIIIKDKSGRIMQRTLFATFENLHEKCNPILLKHGFSFWTEPDISGPDSMSIIMRGHLDHVAGYGTACVIALPSDPTGSKNALQGIGSSLSYGRRYCLINLLNIRSEAREDRDRDGDPNARRHDEPEEKASVEQIEALRKAIADCGATEKMVLEKYGADDMEKFPVSMVAAAISACASFKQRKSGSPS